MSTCAQQGSAASEPSLEPTNTASHSIQTRREPCGCSSVVVLETITGAPSGQCKHPGPRSAPGPAAATGDPMSQVLLGFGSQFDADGRSGRPWDDGYADDPLRDMPLQRARASDVKEDALAISTDASTKSG